MIGILFVLILLGLLVGRIRILGVKIGIAGVLIVSLLLGYLTTKGDCWNEIVDDNVCSFLSSLGTMLFIAAIGLQAGKTSFEVFGKKQIKALASGICIVLIGLVIALLIGAFDRTLPVDLLTGLFSGSMTSTPAMSAGVELYGSSSQVSLGYGISYVIGLLSVIVFIQMFRLPYVRSDNEQKSTLYNNITTGSFDWRSGSTFAWISAAIIVGRLMTLILPIGNTGGVLISGLLFGILSRKKKVSLDGLSAMKKFGLLLFFVGAGMSAGCTLINGFYWIGILYGSLIAVLSIGCGYLIVHYLFKFSKRETLSIICGGMTSTPAIGVLQERDRDVDLSLYSVAYLGALFTLVVSVRVLGIVFA